MLDLVRSCLRRLLPAVALACAIPAHAVEVLDLYDAEAPITAEGEAAHVEALGRALRAVLVKVSGRRELGDAPAIAEAVGTPGRFVQQFEQRQGGAASRLWARFDPELVDRLLAEAGLPVWGRVRPSMTAWLAIERDGERRLVGADEEPTLATALVSSAADRGLPVVMPLLDLEDRMRVDAEGVWAGKDEALREASARYQTEATLAGRMRAVSAGWAGRFVLRLPDAVERFEVTAAVPELLMQEVADAMADRLAARYSGAASAPLEASTVSVEVAGVSSLEHYARVMRHLEAMDGVSAVSVVRMGDDRLWLDVEARGGAERLRQLAALGGVVVPDGELAADGRLRLRLIR
ncbi:MAG: DUF2066 domain-containing protein [Ectothiorhodospiraceae bacterium]|nr:DUF2066 domain-containing protein [Chromatiales bacterium]MCP5157140.1 DUF2066 domain-containing protein [Ectothiorhodospiraceae bacterium]